MSFNMIECFSCDATNARVRPWLVHVECHHDILKDVQHEYDLCLCVESQSYSVGRSQELSTAFPLLYPGVVTPPVDQQMAASSDQAKQGAPLSLLSDSALKPPDVLMWTDDSTHIWMCLCFCLTTSPIRPCLLEGLSAASP